jgi:hypothetical protein
MSMKASFSRRMTVLILCFAVAAISMTGAEGLEFVLNGVRFNGVLLGAVPVPAGLDFNVNVPLSSNGLFYSIRLAGGYEDRLILRDPSNGTPVAKPLAFDDAHWFNWPNGQIDTGLFYRYPKLAAQGKKLEIFALARGRYEINSPGLTTAYFPDAQGLASVSMLGGVGYDGLIKNPSRVKKGFAGEISFEYAPSFLAFSGGTEFFRASCALEGYVPIFSSSEDEKKAVSLYAAAYVAGDYAQGTNIPFYVLTSFGGRLLRDGLGDSIRGYQSWGYEATTKVEASFDLRLVGPALFGLSGLRPIAYVFGDAGYFDGLYNCPAVADKNGLIFSAGVGAALGIFDFAYLGLRAGYAFPLDDPLYAYYSPGPERFFWGITFLLHF